MSCPGRQSGYVLLLTMLALMSLGGIVITGYTQGVRQEAETEKYLHNQRVLKAARQALLMYAFNYPKIAGRGPGRLPCPDTNNTGTPNPTIDCAVAGTDQVGRFPWRTDGMDFYDARDASGERLWYAVSSNFNNFTPTSAINQINSDTAGTITIHDQSGSLLYDGLVAGVAAVIIAPGPEIDRNGVKQDRSVANGDDPEGIGADTDPGIVDADNYLDLFGALDNSDFVNDDSNDGFVLGPIDDIATGTIVVNDQMVVITAEEIIAIAEKATLQAYRNALAAYDTDIDTYLNGTYYPWLYNYEVYDYTEAPTPADHELDEYPADVTFSNEPLDRVGRIPSMFTTYFTEPTSRRIESRFRFDFDLRFGSLIGFTQPLGPCPEDYSGPDCTTGVLSFNNNTWSFGRTTEPLTDVRFVDSPDGGGLTNKGELAATVVTAESIVFNEVFWFWDEWPTGDGFVRCLGVTDDVSDCDRDSGGVNVPQGGNATFSQVIRVALDADFNVNATDLISFELDYDVDPVVSIAEEPTEANHAKITGTFVGSNVGATPVNIVVAYDFSEYYDTSWDIHASGNLSVTDLMANGQLALTLRFYPELPDWAIEDGWHDGIMMAYADAFKPRATPIPPCNPGTDCLTVDNYGGINNDKVAVLVLASEHGWDDDDDPNLHDDLDSIFDPGNAYITINDDLFDAKAFPGDDKILVMDLWP